MTPACPAPTGAELAILLTLKYSDGIVRGDARAGWWIDSAMNHSTEPKATINRYRIIGARPARGNMGPAPTMAPGLVVTYTRDSVHPCPDGQGGKACTWTAYKDGAYLEVTADVTAFEQATIAIPCPKVRKGIDTRFSHGVWQKYLKSEGWVKA